MDKYEWLRKATVSNDERPALRRVHFEDGLAIATDGFSLHVTTAETYPDWRSVMESIDPEAGIYVMVDARKLIKAIEGMDTVILHVSEPMKPIEISGKGDNENGDDEKFYAVVMPMRSGRDDDPESDFWRPAKQDAS